MKRKIRVALLFGGRSAEHEISLRSAKNVADAIDKRKYEVVAIGIDKSGHWLPPAESQRLLASASSVPPHVSKDSGIALIAGGNENKVDVVFPILHGPFGEDGTVQGLLRLANVPFVGAGVLGSAVAMDKDVTKRLLRDACLPIPNFLVATKENPVTFKAAQRTLGIPLFVKPANLGSSVGIAKVRDEKEFKGAMREAFRFDTKVLVEESIKGREIECAVLGNEKPTASVPGEIIVHHDFYSYEAKYLDENGASLEIPAKLPKNTVKKIRGLAIQVFQTVCCEGMARVDFFLADSGKVYVNEINTIPGFTSISMYPKLWEYSGIPYRKLIDKLITLAIERFEKQQKLQVTL